MVGVRLQLYADSLKCVASDSVLLFRAPAPSKYVLLGTSRRSGRRCVLGFSQMPGKRWTVKFDVR